MNARAWLIGGVSILLVCTTGYTQTTAKEKIVACKKVKIDALVANSLESFPDQVFVAHCEPGNIQGFPPRCGGIENNVTPAQLVVKPGYRIVPGSVSLVDAGGNTPSRTGFSITSQDDRQVSAQAYCNGHGCGGQGAIEARARLSARQEYVPTSKDFDNALETCIDEVLGQ
ncbi:MAG TPA: hypothetical protein VJL88_04480 [Nitrospira sp.]|nr:hypothetical protein [Nitrospira sp.]